MFLFSTIITSIIIMMIIPLTMEQEQDQSTNKTITVKDKICESLKRHDDNDNPLKILAVGRTKNRMLLITEDFFVYDVPMDSIDTSINKLYLHAKPTPLSEKYPKLYQSRQFQRIKNKIFNAFIVIDDYSEWICMTTDINSQDGINFDINNGYVVPGWYFTGYYRQTLISTTKKCHFYSLQHYRKNLIINEYKCEGNIRDHSTISPQMESHPLCLDDTGKKIRIEKNSNFVCQSGKGVKWPILKGFTVDEKFYLFGSDYIYIFDENVFLQQGNEYLITKRSYDSFFNCAGVIPEGKIASQSFFYIIIATILLLLFILLTLLWCIMQVTNSPHRKKHHSLLHGKSLRSQTNLPKLSILTDRQSFNPSSSTKKLPRNSINAKITGSSNSVASTHPTVRTGLVRSGASSTSRTNRTFKHLTAINR